MFTVCICQTTSLSINIINLSISVCLSVCLLVCLSIYPCICPCIYPSILFSCFSWIYIYIYTERDFIIYIYIYTYCMSVCVLVENIAWNLLYPSSESDWLNKGISSVHQPFEHCKFLYVGQSQPGHLHLWSLWSGTSLLQWSKSICNWERADNSSHIFWGPHSIHSPYTHL